jgi:RNA polymerase sigma-70 factor (ECF subfamily)
VLLAGRGTSPEGRDALEVLCRTYWPPLYAYVRRDGHSPHDAQDLVQEFIAQVLRRNDLATVGPEKGRFRSFLLSALKNFLVSRGRAAQALKRGGGAEVLSLDDENAEAVCAAELADHLTSDKAFDRRWARMILARALERLQAEHRSPQQTQLFAALQTSLMDGSRVYRMAELAAELGTSPGALAVAATRLRQRYRAFVEDEVMQTVASPTELAAEMRVLREAWS